MMKKDALRLFAIIFFCLPALLFAQQAPNLGCDGSRYKNNTFTTVKKTTVDYAPTVSHTGLAIVLKMDVYEPQDDPAEARPAIILAHGGSFIFGDKSMMQSWCELLAQKGYVAASIQYRIYPVFTLGFPDSVDIFDTAIKAVGDMKAAVRYFREDAATANIFRVDPNNIFIGGYSAGAVAALHAAYLDANDDIPAFMESILSSNGGLEGVSGSASNHTYSSSAKAVANMSGGLYRSYWVDAQGVPLVSIHGTADETVPYTSGIAADIAYLEGSSLVHQSAESAGIWNYLETVPGGGHSDIYDDPAFSTYLNSFIVHATDLLESLVCTSTDTKDVFPADDPDYWTLGPNPSASASVYCFLPVNLEKAQMRIVDMSGRTITQAGVTDGGLVPMKDLSPGIYQVYIANPDQPAKVYPVRQLVKQ